MHFLENSMFVLNAYFCRELRFVATLRSTQIFTRTLLRISEEKIGGWGLCTGPFGPPRNTDEPAIFGLFWSKKSSLGLSSLQMTNNDQNQRDVRRRIIQMVICNNLCCSVPLILVVVGTVLFANYQQ